MTANGRALPQRHGPTAHEYTHGGWRPRRETSHRPQRYPWPRVTPCADYVACAMALTILLVACGAGDDQLDSAADRFCGYLEMRYERSPEEGTLADDIAARASEIDRTPADLHAAIEGRCSGPLETMLRQETTARRGYVLSHQQCSDETYETSLIEQASADTPEEAAAYHAGIRGPDVRATTADLHNYQGCLDALTGVAPRLESDLGG